MAQSRQARPARQKPKRTVDLQPPKREDRGKDRDRPDVARTLFRKPTFQPKGEGQARLCEAIDDNDICFALGAQGTGKTFLAAAKAAEAFKRGRVEKIALFRPYVGTGPSMGFLPGDGDEKMAPYLRPLLEEIARHFEPAELKEMIATGVIELGALEFVRSRTFLRTFTILDEAQNATDPVLRVYLGRLGEGSKMVICGDIRKHPDGSLKQSDLPRMAQGALEDLSGAFLHIEGVARVELTAADIVRHRVVKEMVEAGL